MTAKTENKEATTGLALMRQPFPHTHISKLPKPTKQQTDEVRQNFKAGIRCDVCGGWHHPKVVHLDYVGHAALTDRLLDCDPEWNWEPLALDDAGLPALDRDGGLWIKLTFCGVTRLGYGDAQGKTGGDAMKERIGDAIRNAAMRGGGALDLWHKGDLHADDDKPEDKEPDAKPKTTASVATIAAEQVIILRDALAKAEYPEDGFLKKAELKSIADMPAARFNGALAHIQQVGQSVGEKK